MMCELLIGFTILFVILLLMMYQRQMSEYSWTQIDQLKQTMEGYQNKVSPVTFVKKDEGDFANYLYPTVDSYCYEKGLMTPEGPKMCSSKNFTLYSSNCRCVDAKGNCKICWDPVDLSRKYS